MLRLFAIENSLFNDDKTFNGQLALVDGARREKVTALALREKQNQSLAAGVILPLALKKCGIAGEVCIENGLWEKPRLVSPKGVFYNLSHSGDLTVVALADSEVGVDVQQVKPVDMRLAKRFFTDAEWRQTEDAGDGAAELFYRFWTVKEAYLKALGTGLNRPLNSFSVRFTAGGAKISDGGREEGWLVSEFSCFSGYALACVAKEYAPDFTVEMLQI
ncbi:MAG: 4'-phosphopantetheinyl transferase superfamily protein [Clostridiales bacterium]|nr:4'-phosphopantetheinyl transferase superfamily protein [Clostridiales bacterium]